MCQHRPVARLLALTLLAILSAGAQQNPGSPAKSSPGTTAQNLTIHFEPQATQIRFRVRSLLRDVHGTFQLKGGALAVDPDSTLAQGQLLVDATTGKIANVSEERQMQEDVLETKRYPSIFFHAEHLRGQVPKADGSSDVVAEGMLNIHGADHPFQMKVHLVRQGDSLMATTHFTVPYVDWGMKAPRATLVRLSKTADVDVSAKASLRTVPRIQSGTPSNDSDEEGPQ